MTDHTHYYLHLFDGHGRGRQQFAPQIVDPVAGQILEFLAPPTPALERNAILTGRTTGACARITRVVSTTKCIVETVPRTAAGLAFAQLGAAFSESIDLDNCQGTGSGYLVNNGGGYSIGATSIVVDTGVGTMLVGDGLKFSGHATVYNVATALASNTVVITPALTASVANNEAITLRGGVVLLSPIATAQAFPAGNGYISKHHDDSLSARIDGGGLGDWPYWDAQAKVCELIVLAGVSGTFRKGDDCSTSAGGRFTVQVATNNGGGVWGLYILRKRGTVAVANTVTNLTTTGTGGIAAVAANGAVPTGMFVPYSPHPNCGGTVADDFFWEFIAQGNGGVGESGIGPDAKLMHLLEEYHGRATNPEDRHFRMIPFCSWDVEGSVDGNLGGITVQVVKCSGTFPASGTLVVGQTVTRGSWSGTVHGWSDTNKYLFVRATNGATLTAGTLTLSGGATVTGTGAAFGWAKGSTHWNNLVATIAAATTAFGAISGTAAIKWDGIIAQPWETEINLHHPAVGCPYTSDAQVQQGWLAFVTALRTYLGDTTVPVAVWKHKDESHISDVYITAGPPAVSFAWYLNTILETLPTVVSRLTLVRPTDFQMANDSANLYLRTDDYVELGERFFSHLQFGQIDVDAGDGLEEVAVGVYVGQSQMTGYIPYTSAATDGDPDLWPTSAGFIVSTVDQNLLSWNPVSGQIVPKDIAINGGNGSWGTLQGTCGPELPVDQRMKMRFSSDPAQSTRFVSFKFTVPGSSISSEVIDSTACWDPSLTSRPATTATCTVSVLSSPARGRFTAAAGTFTGPQWLYNSSLTVAGSALGAQGIGGNNSPQWSVQRITAVASDGSWVEIGGTFVAETAVSFTITVGPPPIWPEFVRQWVAFQRDCQRLGIIPRCVFIAFEQGESDLDRVDLYEAALRRLWTALTNTCAKRLKGSEAVARCQVLMHSQTPFLPYYSASGTGSEELSVQAAAADAKIAELREIQTTVAADLGNCVVVDPSDLPLEINQFGSFPRTDRRLNGVHHTDRGMIIKGFRIDAALATLGASKGIPAHPKGEIAVDFGAVNGGTTDSGTDGGTDATTDAPTAEELVPETGAGLALADSYLSLAEAEARIELRAVPAGWTAATDDQKALWLREAAGQGIDLVFASQWQGIPTNDSQALQWPRLGVVDRRRGRAVAINVVPDNIKWMQVEWALLLAQSIDPLRNLMPDTDAALFATAATDSLPGGFSESRSYGDGRPTLPSMTRLQLLAAPFIDDEASYVSLA